MNKKIGISVLVSVLILAIITGVGVYLSVDRDPIPLPEESEVSEPSTTQPPSTQPVESTEPETEEPDRTLVFDNRVTVQKKGDSYVDKAEDAVPIYNGGDYIDSYKFSNGFAIRSTRNLELRTYDREVGILCGDGEAIVTVEEKDPLSKSVQELRVDLLQRLGFGLYLSYETEGLPYGSDCTIEDGFNGWETYFVYQPYTDPTHMEWGQLLCDDIIDTAFGPALYMEYYKTGDKFYYADAFILCDRERILHINIKDDKDRDLWSYLLEVTNDAVTLVK